MGLFKKADKPTTQEVNQPQPKETKMTKTETTAAKTEGKTADDVMAEGVAKGQQLVAPQEQLPDFLQGYEGPMGSENIDNEDITIPRLKVAQAIQDEVKDGLLKEGALYINVTGESLWEPGDAPLLVLFVAQSKEYILWRPRDDGGGILARAQPVRGGNGKPTRYKWDNPNETFEVKVEGKFKTTWKTKEYIDEDGLAEWGSELPDQDDSGPAATAHHNYLLLVPSANVVCAISLSRSGVKIAKNLNAAIKMGDASKRPLETRKFHITTVEEVNDNGDKYKNWNFKPAGLLQQEDAALAREAMGYAKNFRDGGFTVEQSDDKPSGGSSGGNETDEDIPF